MTRGVGYAHDKLKAPTRHEICLGSYGTRGDIEPSTAVGRELLRRGTTALAVPPNLVGLVESAGLEAVALRAGSATGLTADFLRNFWKSRRSIGLWREAQDR